MSDGIFIFTFLTSIQLYSHPTPMTSPFLASLFLSVEAFSCTVAFPPIIGQHVLWRHKSFLIHSSSVPSFSCTQGHKGCWSLSQLSTGRGTVTPWVSWQFIAGLPRKTNNHSHLHSSSQFRVSNSAHVRGWTAGGNRSTLTATPVIFLNRKCIF